MAICPSLPHLSERGLETPACNARYRRAAPSTGCREACAAGFPRVQDPALAQAHGFVSVERKGNKLGQANRVQQAASDASREGVPGACQYRKACP